jgi:hypothetical protein
MPMHSKLFSNDRSLEACLMHDSAHITLGATGDHVGTLCLRDRPAVQRIRR